ncbi:carbamoyl phosphate synthase small subunit [Sulfoacidibacillus thermotolerans]|uniref:Carbamoyl phosphate synthase small chain n=1 Tax=Sulfoacidibacillus thermotolerans TaxID=1765684 RepID=A0A2U3D7R9_SULT2|nr:carbamoyl phosphate synthase small subunit [Sulfoacidibacillus thermotolerans]PWI57324.1 carbamoyl phosphate synthase small subunit [Sulfoacidibacillus thermotolerans]
MGARLLLEDGTLFEGTHFGASGESFGEVVFNTGMTGFQEVLTDPSYYGQIVTMTYPLIGNYGCTVDDMESTRSHVRGFVVRSYETIPSHFKSEFSLDDYLKREGVVAIADIDTRKLTRILRVHGTMKGVITSLDTPLAQLQQRLADYVHPVDQVAQVTTKTPYRIPGEGLRVVLLDFGVKMGVLRSLRARNCDVVVLPAYSTYEEIMAWGPNGLMMSNGPGDPMDLPEIVETIKRLIGRIPIFGICMGHQLLCLARGAQTEKLRFGHRGANHPVKDLRTGRVYMTSQNHGYVVREESLRNTNLELTHINQNDGTVEGVRVKQEAAFSVQYHPEARPGPDDSDELFDEFIQLMKQFVQGGDVNAKTK